MVRKLAIAIVIEMLVYAGIFFIPAGTVHWWRAWVYLGLIFSLGIVATAALFPEHADLLEERMKPIVQRGQPAIDKVVTVTLIAVYCGDLLFIPLDVFHWRLLPPPPEWLSDVSLPICIAGGYLAYLAMRENSFAAPVVKHMEERRQKVIDTGVYSIVRHPMYTGALPFFVCTPLWFQSTAATLFALVPCGVMAARILVEERFLCEQLPGYQEYRRTVRYRLIPGVW